MKRLIIGLGLPALALAMLLAALGSVSNIRPAEAAAGDLLDTVTVPVASSSCCGVGIAYDGANILYTNFGDPTIHKTDLSGANNGALPLTDAAGAPLTDCCNAIAYDASTGTLWGGTWNQCDIYEVDLSTGVGTLRHDNLLPCPVGFVDGLAWDPVNDTLWWSDDVNCTVTEINKITGATLRTFNFGTLTGSIPNCPDGGFVGCASSGLAVGLDHTLFMGSNGCGIIYSADASPAAPAAPLFLGSFATVGGRDEDMECGPQFTKPDGSVVETLLSKDTYNNTFAVIEMAPGQCLSPTTPAGKAPQFSNIWLCEFESAVSDNCNHADIGFTINPNITTADPKCIGFPNFRPDAECDRQDVGGWEFEIRYDQKYINVDLEAAYPLIEGIDFCATTQGQGFVQIRCNTKGKDLPLNGISHLAVAHITPTSDDYSLLKANQENGIVTQLINQDCNLFDTQGHPISLEGGHNWCENDGAVTVRYLEGDVHSDCTIDIHDQQQIAFRWGSHEGQLLYNSIFDLEPSAPKLGDGDIDGKDIQTVFGRHDSNCKLPHPAQPPVDPKAKVEPPINGG